MNCPAQGRTHWNENTYPAPAGRKVPEDVSILGVDSSPTFDSLFPDLTTMEYPRDWVASEILRILSGRGKPSEPPRLSIVLRKT